VGAIKSGGCHVNNPELPWMTMLDASRRDAISITPGVSRGTATHQTHSPNGALSTAASWEKTFVDPHALFFQQIPVFGYEIGLFVMFPLIFDGVGDRLKHVLCQIQPNACNLSSFSVTG
jgi:hypothetical protein